MKLRTKDARYRLTRRSEARLFGLYLLSRRANWSLLALTALALATWTYTWVLIYVAEIGVGDWALIPMMIAVAPTMGSIVGVSAHSPFGDLERTVARLLSTLRAGHLGSLILCAALFLIAVLGTFDLRNAWPEHPLLAFPRNLLGYAGFALLGARLIGARVSWFVPFAMVSLPFSWSLWSGTDAFSWLVALSAFAMGFGAICFWGARDLNLQSGWGDG
ncbi:hypothetical protein BH23ACT11_BH23ACT11_19070 [soil metagenome]